MTEEIKLCLDCANRDFDVNPSFCAKRFVNPANGNNERLSLTKARNLEWACGAEGKYFGAKENKEKLRCLVCGSISVCHEQYADGRIISIITCNSCFSKINFDFCRENIAVEKYRKLMAKVFVEPVAEDTSKPIISLALWARHKNAKWIAMDCDESWFWFEKEPEENAGFWWTIGKRNKLDLEYRPCFSGDWKDSKLKRPEGI